MSRRFVHDSTRSVLLAACALGMATALPAPAQEASCRDTWRQLCGDVDLPKERRTCLRAHLDEFSNECALHQRDQIQAHRRALGQVYRTCRAVRREQCPKLEDPPDVLACLEEHEERLPPDCAEALAHYDEVHDGLD